MNKIFYIIATIAFIGFIMLVAFGASSKIQPDSQVVVENGVEKHYSNKILEIVIKNKIMASYTGNFVVAERKDSGIVITIDREKEDPIIWFVGDRSWYRIKTR